MKSADRPSRVALSNWPVRWKVLAIAAVPLILAGVSGGLRIHSSVTEAGELQRAAERARRREVTVVGGVLFGLTKWTLPRYWCFSAVGV